MEQSVVELLYLLVSVMIDGMVMQYRRVSCRNMVVNGVKVMAGTRGGGARNVLTQPIT